MRWLDRHAGAPSLAAAGTGTDRVGSRVAWLTGQSDWSASPLSPAQHAVLDALAVDGWVPVRAGLPWTTTATGPYRTVPLLAAAARNAAQHLAARRGTRFARQVAAHLQPLLDGTTDRLLLLCGSTGAQLLGVAAPLLAVPPGLELRAVALGPVGVLPAPGGPWDVRVVRGAQDRISRWGCRRASDVVVPGGHLDAGTGAAAVAAVRRLAAGVPA